MLAAFRARGTGSERDAMVSICLVQKEDVLVGFDM